MKVSPRLHLEAMEHMDHHEYALKRGDLRGAQLALRTAYALERAAAEMTVGKEPTCSILHVSAASLGLMCGYAEEVRDFIKTRLPHQGVLRDELRELLDKPLPVDPAFAADAI